MNNKKILIIVLLVSILLVAIIITTFIIINNNNNNDNNQERLSELERYHEDKIEMGSKFTEERKFEGLDMHDIRIVDNGNKKIFRASFTNNTDQLIAKINTSINLVDKNGKVLAKLFPSIIKTNPGETVGVVGNIYGVDNIQDIYDFTIEKYNLNND